MKRRTFLTTATTGALMTCFPATLRGISRETQGGRLERRSLGRTGVKLSVIGFGGIVVSGATPDEATARVREAIERGVNYFDVAPTYGDAEVKLGPALEPYRKDVFLACKTTQRRRAEANAELERSLERLRTDHLDLYQLHAVTKMEEVETICGPGGALEAFLAARQAGKVRFLGFSAHSVDAALALMDRFPFDTILFPFNYRAWQAGNFGPQVLERARKKKMGILALKALADKPWPKEGPHPYPKCWYEPLSDPEDARLALRFTLSHPITAAIPPGDEHLFSMALGLAQNLKPLSRREAQALKIRALAGEPIFRHMPA